MKVFAFKDVTDGSGAVLEWGELLLSPPPPLLVVSAPSDGETPPPPPLPPPLLSYIRGEDILRPPHGSKCIITLTRDSFPSKFQLSLLFFFFHLPLRSSHLAEQTSLTEKEEEEEGEKKTFTSIESGPSLVRTLCTKFLLRRRLKADWEKIPPPILKISSFFLFFPRSARPPAYAVSLQVGEREGGPLSSSSSLSLSNAAVKREAAFLLPLSPLSKLPFSRSHYRYRSNLGGIPPVQAGEEGGKEGASAPPVRLSTALFGIRIRIGRKKVGSGRFGGGGGGLENTDFLWKGWLMMGGAGLFRVAARWRLLENRRLKRKVVAPIERHFAAASAVAAHMQQHERTRENLFLTHTHLFFSPAYVRSH